MDGNVGPHYYNIMKLLTTQNVPNPDPFYASLSRSPTLKAELNQMFLTINSKSEQVKTDAYMKTAIEVILLIDFEQKNFNVPDIYQLISYLSGYNQYLSSFNLYQKYSQVFDKISDYLGRNNAESEIFQTINVHTSIHNMFALSIFAKKHKGLCNNVFGMFKDIDDNQLCQPILVLSLSHLITTLSETESQDDFFQIDRMISMIKSALQSKCPFVHQIILHFLINCQPFFTPSKSCAIVAEFMPVIAGMFQEGPEHRDLLTILMEALPPNSDCQAFTLSAQLSAFFPVAAKYIDGVDTQYTKRIISFAFERRNDIMFLLTIDLLPGNKDTYTTGIQIGVDTQYILTNAEYCKKCFPDKPDPELFTLICQAIPFCIQKNVVNMNNFRQIGACLFYILSSSEINNAPGLKDASAKALEASYVFMPTIVEYVIKYIPTIQSVSCLAHLCHIVVEKENMAQQSNQSYFPDEIKEYTGLYLRDVATLSRLIVSSRSNEQAKNVMIAFLTLFGSLVFEKAVELPKVVNVGNEKSHSVSLLVQAFVPLPLMSQFIAITTEMFRKDSSYCIVFAAFKDASQETMKDAYQVVDTMDPFIIEQFVLFYKTRLVIDPIQTINHLTQVVNDLLKGIFKKKILPEQFTKALLITLTYAIQIQLPIEGPLMNLIEKAIPTNLELLGAAGKEACTLVDVLSRQHSIKLSESFADSLLTKPIFAQSHGRLMNFIQMNKQRMEDVIRSWASHLEVIDCDREKSPSVAEGLFYPALGKQILYISTECLTDILDQTNFPLPIIEFIYHIASYARKIPDYSCNTFPPDFIINSSKYCLSDIEEIRITAYKMFTELYRIDIPNKDTQEYLAFYDSPQTPTEKTALFLELFTTIFCSIPHIAVNVLLEKLSALSNIQLHHSLMMRALLDKSISTKDSSLEKFVQISLNLPLNVRYHILRSFHDFAINDIPSFIYFICRVKPTEIIKFVVSQIAINIEDRPKFLEEYTKYLWSIKVDREHKLNLNNSTFALLTSFALSDRTNELNKNCIGILVNCIVTWLGMMFIKKKHQTFSSCAAQLKELNLIFSFITNQQTTTPFSVNDIDSLVASIRSITDVLQRLEPQHPDQLQVFCDQCEKAVSSNVGTAILPIGIAFILLANDFTEYRAKNSRVLAPKLWEKVSKVFNRAPVEIKRVYCYVIASKNMLTIPRLLTSGLIDVQHSFTISNVEKSHIFVQTVDSITDKSDLYLSESVDVMCTLLPYLTSETSDIQHTVDVQKTVSALQNSFGKIAVTPTIMDAILFLVKLKYSVLGDPKVTKLNNVELIKMTVHGKEIIQQKSMEVLIRYYHAYENEEEIKNNTFRCYAKALNKLKETEVHEINVAICASILNGATVQTITPHWLSVITEIAKAFDVNRVEVSPFFETFFQLCMDIVNSQKHICYEAALKAMRSIL